MKKILITGFEPFGKHDNNPSKIILESDFMPKVNNIKVKKIILSNDFDEIHSKLKEVLNNYEPDIVISLGLDSKIITLKIEKVALNLSYDHVNKGKLIPINNEGKDAYINILNLNKLAKHLAHNNIPSIISYHAGIYSCNYIYYLIQEWSNTKNKKSIFIHLPYTHEMASESIMKKEIIKPSLSQKIMEKGIEEVIKYLTHKN